jgi:hypothetical protein
MSEFGVILLTFAGVIGLVGLIKFLSWLTELQESGGIIAAARRGGDRYLMRRESVNHYQTAAPSIMSRAEDTLPPSIAPSLQTRPIEITDQTEDKAARQKKLLDTYTPLKWHGFSRDEARMLLGLWNIPLDNNLWAKVPEKPESSYTTPIAGRVTAAQFETEPDLLYQPPPGGR